ncbi:MAG: hypothetical protein Q4B99_01460 [Clostridia bacterium]|nr:hypothetical protein [Clostridia bacterium]
MWLVVLERFICELALYQVVFGYLGSCFNMSRVMYVPLACYAAVSLACWFLRRKRLIVRLLPLLCIPAVIALYTYTYVDLICLVPPAVMVIVNCVMGRFEPDADSFAKYFVRGLYLLVPVLLLSMLAPGNMPAEQITLPFAIVYLVVAVIVMRSLRHDEDIINRPSFMAINAGVVIVVCLLSAMLSTDVALESFRWLSYVIGRGFGYILEGIRYVLALLMMPFFTEDSVLFDTPAPSATPSGGTSTPAPSPTPTPTPAPLPEPTDVFPPWVMVIFFVIIVGAIMVILFVKGPNRAGRKSLWEQQDAKVRKKGGAQSSVLTWLKRDTPQDKVRKQYKRYLRMVNDESHAITPYMTTADIANRAAVFGYDAALGEELRRLYLRARYAGEADTSDAEAIEAKRLVDEIKRRRHEAKAEVARALREKRSTKEGHSE